MFCSKDPENINIKMNGEVLKQTSNFQYTGSIFKEDGGKIKKNVMQQVKGAKFMFNNKTQIPCSSNISLEIKKQSYNNLHLECCWLWIRDMGPRKE